MHMEILKAELLKSVAEETNTPYARVQTVADALCETIIRETAAGGPVRIPPLGVFEKAERTERETVNPRTGEKMTVEAHGAVRFRPSTMFKAAVK